VLADVHEGWLGNLFNGCRGVTLGSCDSVVISLLPLTHLEIYTCTETVGNVLIDISLGGTLGTSKVFDSPVEVLKHEVVNLLDGSARIVGEVLGKLAHERNAWLVSCDLVVELEVGNKAPI
jgi:hypothetical protein